MNPSESKTIQQNTNTSRALALVVCIASIAIGLALWQLRDSYQRVTDEASYAAEASRHHQIRIDRLERDYEALATRLDRRLENVESGVQEIRIWVAEQRGREGK